MIRAIVKRIQIALTRRRAEAARVPGCPPLSSPAAAVRIIASAPPPPAETIRQLCRIGRCEHRAAAFIRAGWTPEQVLTCLLIERRRARMRQLGL